MIRATNWLGDAVMSLPAIRTIRAALPHAHLAVVARAWVGDLYAREKAIDRVIPYAAKSLSGKRAFAKSLHAERFDAAILLQNAFDAALMAWMAGTSAAHRIQTRRAWAAAHVKRCAYRSRAIFRVMSASTIWSCCGGLG